MYIRTYVYLQWLLYSFSLTCISVSIIYNIGYSKLLRHLSVVLQINAVTSSSVMCMVCVLRTSVNVWSMRGWQCECYPISLLPLVCCS